MIHYLVNFICCSGLFLLVYYAFLSQGQFFQFNRFYLLCSLILSLILPAVTIKYDWTGLSPIRQGLSIENVVPVKSVNLSERTPTSITDLSPANSKIDWITVAFLVYGFITLILLTRFSINLFRIRYKIHRGSNIVHGKCRLVLIDKPTPPHSFFNYIFLDRIDYESQKLQPEILCHELVHARQLHSIDVLVIELFQAICWFNPFIPLYRNVVQLNHEYLADAAVVLAYNDKASYQHLILNAISETHFSRIKLSSEFNYKTIKKRLVMLNTTTSKVAGICRQLAVLPAIAVAALLFSQQVAAQSSPAATKEKSETTLPDIIYATSKAVPEPLTDVLRPQHATFNADENVMKEYNSILKRYDLSDTTGETGDISKSDRIRLHNLFTVMSARQQDAQWVRFEKVASAPVMRVREAELKSFVDSTTYGIYIDNRRTKNAELAKYSNGELKIQLIEVLAPVTSDKEGYRVKVNLTKYTPEDSKTTLTDLPEHLEHFRRMKKGNI